MATASATDNSSAMSHSIDRSALPAGARSSTATSHPPSRNSETTSAPMPLAPPVTRARVGATARQYARRSELLLLPPDAVAGSAAATALPQGARGGVGDAAQLAVRPRPRR